MKSRKITAFFLIELSIVILVIGLLIAGAIQGSKMLSKATLTSARTLTEGSTVASIKSLSPVLVGICNADLCLLDVYFNEH